jgi:hypothetical protein
MQRTILNIKVKIRKAMKAGKKIPKINLLIQRQSSNKIQILPQLQREESVILPDPPLHIQGHAIKGNHRRTLIKIHGAYRAKKALARKVVPHKVYLEKGANKTTKNNIQPMRMHPSAHTKAAINGKIHKPTWREIQTRPYTARVATIAAKAMHGSAPNTPYETMRGDSHTPAAKAIQNKLKPIKRRKSTQEETQFLKQIFPLNPNTRRGCPCCGQEIAEYVVADYQHYAMGHCTRTQKHMTVDFGNKIAAWVICQSCPKTFTTPEPNHPKMRLDIRSTKKEKADHIVNSKPDDTNTNRSKPRNPRRSTNERNDSQNHKPNGRG